MYFATWDNKRSCRFAKILLIISKRDVRPLKVTQECDCSISGQAPVTEGILLQMVKQF